LARAGAPWRWRPNDFPPWTAVYQQWRRWNEAGSFEAMVNDMRSIIRVSQGRKGQPSAAVIDGRTLQGVAWRRQAASAGAGRLDFRRRTAAIAATPSPIIAIVPGSGTGEMIGPESHVGVDLKL
jgi:transposase